MAIRQPLPRLQRASRYNGRRMTEAQYLALPEEKPYLEYVDGVVIQKPMPNAIHRKLVKYIVVELALYERRAGGDSGPEGRIRLGDGPSYRIPDAAYWAPGRPSGDDSIPTLVVEVRSPGQTIGELREKCRFYRRSGVEACWLIDPEGRTTEVFDAGRDGQRFSGAVEVSSPAVPGFAVSPSALFAAIDE
ncbi:MAG: Uma2 family endonuclease [Dehalococcoidia bacterium]|nr:Uma2 family endonuclease [Dehalococcoidia bacterium]